MKNSILYYTLSQQTVSPDHFAVFCDIPFALANMLKCSRWLTLLNLTFINSVCLPLGSFGKQYPLIPIVLLSTYMCVNKMFASRFNLIEVYTIKFLTLSSHKMHSPSDVVTNKTQQYQMRFMIFITKQRINTHKTNNPFRSDESKKIHLFYYNHLAG